ncbi:MAG TPA: S8 family serine peptidase, partial [Pseudonocardiaceae bacterium]|nr:S8 family serine peptidase [Pseudonocardiaceae bacterium]
DYAVNVDKVDVINQSFGATLFPDGAVDPIALADEAAIAAGVTVVASSGDSGQSGTVGTPSSAPDVIAAAGTTAFRLDAQDKGYPGFVSDNISSLSSGGPTLDNKYVDIAAPAQSAMTDCTVGAPWPECTQNSESFGGTSESSPFIAGAAALVIQAYQDSHGGAKPSPALVKQLLLGTATDLDVPSDQQGAGLLNSLAAVQAARAIGNDPHGSASDALVPSTTQFDVTGAGGSTQHVTETLTNTSRRAQTVTGSSRTLGSQLFQFDRTVQVTGATPAPANPPGGPGEAPQAAPSVTFTVPKNVPFMTAEMTWPGTRTSGQLDLELFDPSGNLVAESYDFGFTDFQHVSVHNPTPGTWTEKILWNNGRDHFQEALDGPGTFRGGVTLRNTGFRYVSAGTNTVTRTIPAGGSARFAFDVPLPKAAGDAPASLQFDSDLGTHVSVPLARRVLIPTGGSGRFTTTLTGGVGRGLNQYLSYFLDVPKNKQDMTINFTTIDPRTSVGFLLVSPTGQVLSGDTNAVETAWNTGRGTTTGAAEMTVNQPAGGRWEVITFLQSPSSGDEFSQTLHGQVQFNTVHVQAKGLPDDARSTLSGAVQATVRVRNTSAAGEFFFVDPRLNQQADVTLPPIAGQNNIDLPEDTASTNPPVYNVPTHTTTLTQHFSSTVPADDYLEFSDGNPGPYLFAGTSGVNTISDSDQLAFGPWFTDVGEVGPFPGTAPAGTATLSLTAHMRPFDTAVTSGTGDFWLTAVGGSAGNAVFIPAGGTATIPVTITPTAKSGTVVRGTLYVDTWNNLFGQGSELAGIPYSYTAG